MKRNLVTVAAATVCITAAWSALRWLDARHARLTKPPRKAVENWENEGGALSAKESGALAAKKPGALHSE